MNVESQPEMNEYAISIIIPAHNEEAVIARLLSSLSDRRDNDEVIVVCDGCSDRTAEIARSFARVTVMEQLHSGKPSALNTGDLRATRFPRFFVDADIVVTATALHEVAIRMTEGVEAGAPRCHVNASGSSWAVRKFYEVWTKLPYFNDHMIGSGIVGVSSPGRARFSEFPSVINDDECIRRLFSTEERVGWTASSFTVTAPAGVGPLIRIKTRARLGIMQLNKLQGLAPSRIGPSTRSALIRLLESPRVWPSVAVFLAVRVVVEARAWRLFRRGNFGGWERDETSRVAMPRISTTDRREHADSYM